LDQARHEETLAELLTEGNQFKLKGFLVVETAEFRSWSSKTVAALRRSFAPQAEDFQTLTFHVQGFSLHSEHVQPDHAAAFEHDIQLAEDLLRSAIAHVQQRSTTRQRFDYLRASLPRLSKWVASVGEPVARVFRRRD
jgi:hypothetical protein